MDAEQAAAVDRLRRLHTNEVWKSVYPGPRRLARFRWIEDMQRVTLMYLKLKTV